MSAIEVQQRFGPELTLPILTFSITDHNMPLGDRLFL
jgi:hypothetical protein